MQKDLAALQGEFSVFWRQAAAEPGFAGGERLLVRARWYTRSLRVAA
jgi:hypothetical protein